MKEGEDYYYNSEGMMVFTEQWHQKRGHCCGSGCLHCPFNYEKVPNWLREKLIKAGKIKP